MVKLAKRQRTVPCLTEIVCSQYVSLYGHADGIGYAKSVLKFDTSQQKFIVINAKFDTMTQEDG